MSSKTFSGSGELDYNTVARGLGDATIVIIEGYSIIGEGAFFNRPSLTSVTIGSSVTSIGENAFKRCTDLESINIPNSVTAIGDSVFQDCASLTSVTIPDRVTDIGFATFSGCSKLELVIIGTSVKTIGSYAFGDCLMLTSINIPGSVTDIGDHGLYNCPSLTSLNIPDSVLTIGSGAFAFCMGLEFMTFGGPLTTANTGTGIFEGIVISDTRKFTFYLTFMEIEINTNLLGQIQLITVYYIPSSTGPQIYFLPTPPPPPIVTTVITIESSFYKVYGEMPFNLIPTSTSNAPYIYASNSPYIAAVNSATGLVTLITAGDAVITIYQNAISGFTAAMASTTIYVAGNTPSNPTDISSEPELQYFLTTNAEYCDITDNIIVTTELINTGDTQKILMNNTNALISITKN